MRLDYKLQYIIKWIVYFLNSKGKVLILLLASESYWQKKLSTLASEIMQLCLCLSPFYLVKWFSVVLSNC